MNKFRRDTLCRALLAAGSAETAYFDTLPEVKEAHTSTYLNFIQELKTSGAPRKAPSVGKLAALIAVAALLFALFTACAFFSPVREFFVEIFEGHLELIPSNQGAKYIEEIRAPGYVPEGYTLMYHKAEASVVIFDWENGDNYIRIEQNPLFNGSIDLDTDAGYEIKEIGGQKGFYTERYNTRTFIWNDGKYTYTFNCHSELVLEEIEKMILSIEERPFVPTE